METKKVLASAAAATLAAPAAAGAADLPNSKGPAAVPVALSNPLFVSIEGGAAFSDFTKKSDLAAEKLGGAKRDLGAFGSISIGRSIEGTAYDWRVNASATQFMNNDAAFGNFYYGLGTTSKAGWQSADLEIGRTIKPNDIVEMRVFGGVRVLNQSASQGVAFEYAYGLFAIDGSLGQKFLGFGPRVGAEVRVGRELGLVGSVSAARLYGRNEASFNIGYTILGYELTLGALTESKMDWVTDVTASLAGSYKPSEKTELKAGYRTERLYNVNAPQGKNLTSHGPFVKVDAKF